MITHVSNKVIINLERRKYNNLFKPLIKKNIKYIKFNQLFNYFLEGGLFEQHEEFQISLDTIKISMTEIFNYFHYFIFEELCSYTA